MLSVLSNERSNFILGSIGPHGRQRIKSEVVRVRPNKGGIDKVRALEEVFETFSVEDKISTTRIASGPIKSTKNEMREEQNFGQALDFCGKKRKRKRKKKDVQMRFLGGKSRCRFTPSKKFFVMHLG